MAQSPNRYLAMPKDGSGPGVLVLHPWWGFNTFMQQFCDRLAGEGFVALAPDLYHGKIAQTIEEAEQLSSALPFEQATAEILAAVAALREHPAVGGRPLAVIGFSMGAFFALWLAEEKPQEIRAITLFYGTGGEVSKTEAAFLGHFADSDPYEPLESVKELEESLRSAGRTVQFYTYEGTGHWFFEADRPDAYHPQAAQLAWERTLAFLREQS